MEKPSATTKKKNVTLAMIIIFSIILVATTAIGDFLIRSIIQIVAFVGQLLVVKALLDDYYQE